MRRHAWLAVVMTLAVAGLALAQATPDFSGTWVLDPARSDRMGPGGGAPPSGQPPTGEPPAGAPPSGGPGGGRGPGGPMVIAQTPTELKITRGENIQVFKLDGTESVNKTPRGESKSTATIDGAKIVIKTTMDTPRGTMQQTATYSLSADGKELTVVTGGQRGDRKMVYTRQ